MTKTTNLFTLRRIEGSRLFDIDLMAYEFLYILGIKRGIEIITRTIISYEAFEQAYLKQVKNNYSNNSEEARHRLVLRDAFGLNQEHKGPRKPNLKDIYHFITEHYDEIIGKANIQRFSNDVTQEED